MVRKLKITLFFFLTTEVFLHSVATAEQTPELKQIEQIHPKHLARILTLTDEQIDYYIGRNHRFTKLSPEEKQKARQELIEFRDSKRSEALKRALMLDLEIPEEKVNEYIETYWQMQLEMERKLEAYVRPLRQQMEAENILELQKRFSLKVTRGQKPSPSPVINPNHTLPIPTSTNSYSQALTCFALTMFLQND